MTSWCAEKIYKSEVNRQDPSLRRAVERGVVLLRREVDLARRVRRRVPAAAARGAGPTPRIHIFLEQMTELMEARFERA